MNESNEKQQPEMPEWVKTFLPLVAGISTMAMGLFLYFMLESWTIFGILLIAGVVEIFFLKWHFSRR